MPVCSCDERSYCNTSSKMWMCDIMVSVSPRKESALCCYDGLYSRRIDPRDGLDADFWCYDGL